MNDKLIHVLPTSHCLWVLKTLRASMYVCPLLGRRNPPKSVPKHVRERMLGHRARAPCPGTVLEQCLKNASKCSKMQEKCWKTLENA